VHGHGGAVGGVDEAQVAGGAHLAAAGAEEAEVGGDEVEAGAGLGAVAVRVDEEDPAVAATSKTPERMEECGPRPRCSL